MKVVRFSWTRVPTRVLYHRKLYQQNSAHDFLYSGLEWKNLVLTVIFNILLDLYLYSSWLQGIFASSSYKVCQIFILIEPFS